MEDVFIIAEAGVNHNGSLDMAFRLVEAARQGGADAVKFQAFHSDLLTTCSAGKADYQKKYTPANETQIEMLRGLELSFDQHHKIKQHCAEVGIEYMASPFDESSADMLASLDVQRFKVPSGEITNLPLLASIAGKHKHILLSTGMSTIGEVEEAVQAIRAHTAAGMTLLHCVTEYPAPFSEINLRVMQTLRTAFGLPVGYSDHTPGIEIALAAAALGATVIEKHMTLDRNLPGPDHKASLEPAEFACMVASIRNVSQALGDGIKAPARCEMKNLLVARKSIVAARSLPAGHRIVRSDLAVKRPGSGLPAKMIDAFLGRTLCTAVERDSLMTWDLLK